MRKKKRFYKVFQYIALLCALIIIIFPVYWIIVSSFKVKEDILSYPPKIFPSQFTLSNYITAFQDYNVLLYLKNSLIVTCATVILTIIIAALAAYAMCFLKMKGARILNNLLYILQVLPTITMMVPLMTIYRMMGIQNTYLSLILTYTAAVSGAPIALILITGYFQAIPQELFESANIDGAGTFKCFYKILLPLGAPGICSNMAGIYVCSKLDYLTGEIHFTGWPAKFCRHEKYGLGWNDGYMYYDRNSGNYTFHNGTKLFC